MPDTNSILPPSPLIAQVPSFYNYITPPTISSALPPPLPPAVPATGQGDPITSGFMSALHEARAQGARAAQAGAQLVGATDTAQSLSDYADQAHATAQSYANPEYENAPWYSPTGLAYRLTQMVPTTAAALGVGGLAALTVPEAAAGAGGLAAATGLRALLLGTTGAGRAARAASAMMFPFAAGENVQRQIAETGELTTPGRALALGVPEAVLQGYLPGHLEQYFGKGVLQGIKHSVIAQGIAAGGTEGLTQLMGDPDRGFADRASDITRQALSGGLLGGIVGGAFGGMRALAGKPAAKVSDADMAAGVDQVLKGVDPSRQLTYRPVTTAWGPLRDVPDGELAGRIDIMQRNPPQTSAGIEELRQMLQEQAQRSAAAQARYAEAQQAQQGAAQRLLPPPAIQEGPPLQDLPAAEVWTRFTNVIEHLANNPQDPTARRAAELLRQEVLRRAAATSPAPAPEAPAAAPKPVPEAPPAAPAPAPAPEPPRAIPALAPAGEPPAVVGAPEGPVAPVAPVPVATPEALKKKGVNLQWNEDKSQFEAVSKDGKVIGTLLDGMPEKGTPEKPAFTASVEVDENWRRQGVASALYDAFAAKHDGNIAPAGNTSKEAWDVWLNKYPDKLAAYVKQSAANIAAHVRSGDFPEEYAQSAISTGFDHPKIQEMVNKEFEAQMKAAPVVPVADRIKSAYDAIAAETGKRIVNAGPLAARAGVTPQEFAAWADTRPDDIQELKSTYTKEAQAKRNRLVVPGEEGQPSRTFWGFQFLKAETAPVPGERLNYVSAGAQRIKQAVDQISTKLAEQEKAKPAANDEERALQAMKEFAATPVAQESPAPAPLAPAPAAPAVTKSIGAMTVKELKDHITNVLNDVPLGRTKQDLIHQINQRHISDQLDIVKMKQVDKASGFAPEDYVPPERVAPSVSQDVTPAKPKTVVDQTDLEGIPAFLDRRAPKTDAPVETTADRAAALSDTARQIGTLKVAPALKDQLSAEVDQLTSQLRGADRNPGYAPTINKKVMELRTTVEKLAQPPADQVAPPGLAPSPRSEAVPAPAGDLDDRIGAAQYALGKLRKVLGPNAAAMLDQHQDWLKAVNKAAVPDEYRAALAADPEANPEANTLSDIPRPPKALVEYLAQQQRVIQELRALSGPESRARVISSRDGLPVTQLDADVTDMHQRGVKPTDIADHIIENSASPEEAELTARLKPFIPENAKTIFRDGVTDKEGEYFPGTQTSALYNAANATQTFIHEMVHATLSRALEGTSTAAEAIRGIYEQLKGKGDHAGITDEHEMVAEAFANPTYRDFLKSQFVKGTSLWDRFVDAARRFIGLPDRLSNAFERIMSLGDDLLKEQQEYPNDAWVGRDSFAHVTDKAASDTAAAADVARSALGQRLEGGKLNMMDRMRGVAFGLINSQRFAPLYAKFAPSIADKIKLEQQHAALDGLLHRPIQLADRISNKVHGDERETLNKVMNDASYFKLDPRKELSSYPEIHNNPDLVNRFNENKLRYNSLSPAGKDAYEAQRAIGGINIQGLMALRLQSAMRAVGMPFIDAFDVYRNDDRLRSNLGVAEKHFSDVVTTGIKTLNDYHTQQSADLATIKAAIKAGLPDDQLEKMTAQRDDLQTNISKVGNVLNDVKKQQIEVSKAPYFHQGRFGDKFLTAKFVTDDDGNVDQRKLAQFADHLEKAGFKDIAVNVGGQNDTFYTRVKNASELDSLQKTIQDAQAKGLISKDGMAAGEASTMYSTLSRNAYEHVVEELLAYRQQPPEGIPDELAASWRDATAHQAQELRRTLLNLLPENSMGRQLAQRRNVQGYSTNMLEQNLQAAKIMARGLAHMAFAPDMGAVSSRMLDDVRTLNASNTDLNTKLAVGQAVNELMLRDQTKQSSYTPLGIADVLHKFTHTMHIGLSPPYVFMLMSQLMTTAWPELAKTHGLGGSASALFKVEGDAFKVIRAIMTSSDKANVAITREALEKVGVAPARINQVMRAVSNGVMDTAVYSTQAHEQGPLSLQKIKSLEVANAMGKYAELFPRLSTLFAAHDLYKAKPVSGLTAEDFAHDAVTESQGDWTPGLSARQTSRGGIAGRLSPLVLQFMGWRIIMTGKMYNEVRNLFQGDDKVAAGRWLLGHAAATTMLAGTLGLPALSIAAAAYDKLMDWVENRDDHDLTASYRGFLADTFGKDMGEIIARGLPRAAGMDFPRFSEADIIPGSSVVQFASEKRKLEDIERDWAKSLVGPAVGDVFNVFSAARDFTNGDLLNGMIKMSPEVLKAPAEAYRLAQRGFVNNLTGQQLPLGKPTTYDIALTMLGIDPGKAAEYAEVNREAVGLNTMRELNSSNIVRHMELAFNRRDPAMMNTWQAESQRWQMQHPGLIPPAASFQRELDNHLRQSTIAQGMGLPVGVRPQDIDVRRALRYGNIGQRPQ